MSEQDQRKSSFGSILFWILWVFALVLFFFYIFTLIFEIEAVRTGDLSSYLSPIIGLVVLIAQAVVMVISFRQMRQEMPLSEPYLSLLGGTILIGFIWAGGCAMMGSFSFH